MVNGVTSATRLGGRRRLRNHGLEVEICTKEYVQVGDIASAEGAKLRLPKARSPFRLWGLGERRKLPSGVWGGAPETDAILNILCQNGVHFGRLLISSF